MTRAENEGFKSLLEGNGFDVHMGEVDSFDPDLRTGHVRRYALILPTYSPDMQTRLTGSHGPRQPSFVVHCYAKTFDESAWLVDKVDELLRPAGWGVIPAVAGRRCERIQRDARFGPERESAGAGLWDAFAEYSFMSYPK